MAIAVKEKSKKKELSVMESVLSQSDGRYQFLARIAALV